jgi:hypothetical protein
MQLKSVTFGTDSRGNASGILGFTISFTDTVNKKSDVEEKSDIMDDIAMAINLVENHRMSKKYKSIFINGLSDDSELEYMILTLLKAFKDRGYVIYLTTTSTIYHSYYMVADYIRLLLKPNVAWAGFQCNEIVYELDKENLIDPEIPELKILKTLSVKTEDYLEIPSFLEMSKYTWTINLQPKNSIKESLFTR